MQSYFENQLGAYYIFSGLRLQPYFQVRPAGFTINFLRLQLFSYCFIIKTCGFGLNFNTDCGLFHNFVQPFGA